MKKKSKVFGFILAFCFMFNVFSSIALFAADAVGSELSYSKNMQSLYTALRFKEEFTIITVRRSAQVSELVYPDNFGGIYIDDNNELHISYTDNKESLMGKVSEDEAIFEEVDYSYNYLLEIYEYLSSIMLDSSIYKVCIDEITNKVVVELDFSHRESLIEQLQENINNFDKNSISFCDPQNAVTTAAGGAGITTTNGTFTLGYNATKISTGEHGFVTCAHGVNAVGDLVYDTNNNILGTVTDRVLQSALSP